MLNKSSSLLSPCIVKETFWNVIWDLTYEYVIEYNMHYRLIVAYDLFLFPKSYTAAGSRLNCRMDSQVLMLPKKRHSLFLIVLSL